MMVRVRCKGPLVAPTHTLSRNRVPNLLPGVIDLLEGGHVKVSLATGGQQQRLALLVAERKGFGVNGALQNVSHSPPPFDKQLTPQIVPPRHVVEVVGHHSKGVRPRLVGISSCKEDTE